MAGALIVVLSVPGVAQIALVDTTLDVAIVPSGSAFTRNQTETTTVSISYTYGPGAAVLEDPQVQLRIEESPPWLEVTLRPRHVVLDVTSGNTESRTTTATANLRLTATVNAEWGAPGTIEVAAEVPETGNLASATDTGTVDVEMEEAPPDDGAGGTADGTTDDGDGTADGSDDGTTDGTGDQAMDGTGSTDTDGSTAQEGASPSNLVPALAFAGLLAAFGLALVGFWLWPRD